MSNKNCPKCGYAMEAENLPHCVGCHVEDLSRQEADSATSEGGYLYDQSDAEEMGDMGREDF